jgi:hypothetical protein
MMANSPVAVAATFSKCWEPTSVGESDWAAMPEPTTVAASSRLPRYSGKSLRNNGVSLDLAVAVATPSPSQSDYQQADDVVGTFVPTVTGDTDVQHRPSSPIWSAPSASARTAWISYFDRAGPSTQTLSGTA